MKRLSNLGDNIKRMNTQVAVILKRRKKGTEKKYEGMSKKSLNLALAINFRFEILANPNQGKYKEKHASAVTSQSNS